MKPGIHLGLVLNVIDRDQDGWGAGLVLQAGYEGFSVSVRRYAPDGFEPAGLTYGGGCWRSAFVPQPVRTEMSGTR